MGEKHNNQAESAQEQGESAGTEVPSSVEQSPAPASRPEPELAPRTDLLAYAAAWNIAWVFVLASIVGVLVLYLFPAARNFAGPHGNEYATAWFLLALPGLSAIWAIAGSIAAERRLQRSMSLLALVAAAVLAVLLWLGV